ncbi:MAG: pyruvate dehydrogenase (acetyl-transferring) E1 component subunit alpha [Brevefilum fermentans]|jgi:pyruvate dehydrogenase E1 component alpha subunit|uniref:Pyruvate dehydrogenase E1 component subunit alpha n=1 Tax=Candidatus Brevifilum fermentans TaxID=1986204 RepID=A0A1Y6K531_9CHLR|nr:pyruvate dehydrogenase (acetyl-transferring) E1 component subunit alpha [Brevefilum fermentans]MDI9565645.1 pyruvate dehydrogenase (acetyl-transferring) E1 component subunit alpha [Chloroflexota bacterium]SMX54791.1 Pyruvate dehydrogenase E1 component subunit alpha [Brevefilum fermentans]HOM66471.1 pyruvate dehydrogenase (acetyl-transferring) E1 component subunit alpha [Brevefilum fermentans]
MEKKDYFDLYREMVVIRRIEEHSAELYQKGKIGGFLHLYIGQEAVCSGICSVKEPQDRIITSYRDHGWAISAGIELNAVMAELLGKVDGCSQGKGGSMHMADVEKNFWGGHAIVGAHIPIAAGMALGDVYLGKDDAVTICVFGDGASNIGFFHEGLNLSKVWNLPVLWVCENNQYGMGTAVDRASAVSEIRLKAESYGMRNERIDGMDVMTVRKEAAKILESIRKGDGPYLLEIMTYRYRGHSMGDPERYREKDEVRKWEEEDPIGIFRKYLIEKGFATEEALNDQDQEAEKIVQEAVDFAEASPEPGDDTLFEHIYAEPTPIEYRGYALEKKSEGK